MASVSASAAAYAPPDAAAAAHINDLTRTTATDFAALRAQQRLAAASRASLAAEEEVRHAALLGSLEQAALLDERAAADRRERERATAAAWAVQVAQRPLRAEAALDVSVLQTVPPRDCRPIWESGDEGIMHNAQTFAAAERGEDPRLVAAKRQAMRDGLAVQVTEQFAAKLAAQEDAAATAWASDAVRGSLDALEAGVRTQRRANALLNAADNRDLARMQAAQRARLAARNVAEERALDAARSAWATSRANTGRAGAQDAEVTDPLGERARQAKQLSDELLAEVVAKERAAAAAKADMAAWNGATLAVEAAACAMALEADAAARLRTEAHFEDVRAQVAAKAMERAAAAAAAKVPQRIADSGLLGALGRNERRLPRGTRS